ncbi:MAG: hypothetical protein ACLQJ0_25655 [Steroidobacteraceae bacterium]|jgi:CheY-like chemotaxis protein
MKSGFLAISKRKPHRFVLVVTSISTSIKSSIAVEHNPDGFDIVVTDLVMPQLMGLGLLQHLRALCGDPPAVDLHYVQSLNGRKPVSFTA